MARLRPAPAGLQRTLTAPALFATAYGNVGSSIYYALGIVAASALGLTPLAFAIAGVIFVCTAMTYAEATVQYPESGGASSFARHAFNESASFGAAWTGLLSFTVTISISAYFVPHYLAVFWSPLGHAPGDIIAGIVIVGALAALNVRGVKEAAMVNIVLSIADLATQVLLVVIGLFLVLNLNVILSANLSADLLPSVPKFLEGLALAMIAYTGIETISNLAEEAREPRKTVPRSMRLTVFAVLGIYAFLPALAVGALPVTNGPDGPMTALGSEFAGDPLLGLVRNFGLPDFAQTILAGYVGILAATILLVAANAGMIGVSRLVYGMAQYRQLPKGLAKISTRFGTPATAIVVFAVIAAVTILPGQADFLGLVYSFGALLTFSVAHLSLIGLRLKDQGYADAPFRVPGQIRLSRGRSVPIFAVVGLFGTSLAWAAGVIFNPIVALTGLGWVLAGFVLYLLYRRRQGLPLLGSVKVVQEKLVAVRAATFADILVPVDTVRTADHATITACQVAMDTGAMVRLVHVIEVPLTLDLFAHVPDAERAAQEALSSLTEYAERFEGVEVRASVLRGRRAGPALVEHIKQTKAQAVVVEAPPFKLSRRLFGRTLEYLLRHAPCEVIVVREHPSSPALNPVEVAEVPLAPDAVSAATGRPDA